MFASRRLLLPLVVAVAFATAAGGCATTPSVGVYAAPGMNPAAYATFAFRAPLALEAAGPRNSAPAMRAAVRAELESRGYRYAPGAAGATHLLVDIDAKLEEHEEWRPAIPMPPVGRCVGGAPPEVPRVNAPCDVLVPERYPEGTLVVALVDARTQALVWEGVAYGRVTAKHLAERDAAIADAVAHVFRKLPARAAAN
jgi:hypothetical protein